MEKWFKHIVTVVVAVALLLGVAVQPPQAVAKEDDASSLYLVKFKSEPEKALKEADIAKENLKHEFDLKNIASVSLTKAQKEKLQQSGHVDYVEANTEAHSVPDQAEQKFSGHLPNLPFGIEHVKANIVHDNGFKGEGVKVAILDSGVDVTHPDLKVAKAYSAFTTEPDADPYVDGLGHGTHVAGTVAGLDNDFGVTGVAPEAEIYSAKVIDANDQTNATLLLRGIEWAINNDVDVINMSMYINGKNKAIQDALDYAYNEKNIVVVAAAGNFGNKAGTGDSVTFPANYPSVISVAASDENYKRASFSSTGPTVEITAPGDGVLSTYVGGDFGMMNGTSMATPHVAGVVALLREIHPDETAAQLRQRMTRTAMPLGDHPQWFGHGLVQADMAAR